MSKEPVRKYMACREGSGSGPELFVAFAATEDKGLAREIKGAIEYAIRRHEGFEKERQEEAEK